MNSDQTIATLNELLHVLCRSLPVYLADARPWTSPAEQRLRDAIARAAADQRHYANRVSEAIESLGGRTEPGQFPLCFTAKNDLSVDYLGKEIIDRTTDDLAAIDQCVSELGDNPALRALAEEIRGNTLGHLDMLKATECQ